MKEESNVFSGNTNKHGMKGYVFLGQLLAPHIQGWYGGPEGTSGVSTREKVSWMKVGQKWDADPDQVPYIYQL
jgi:hypothetical protein